MITDNFHMFHSLFRTCYIAPERFQSRRAASSSGATGATGSSSNLIQTLSSSSELQQSTTSEQQQFLPDADGGLGVLDSGGELQPSMDVFSVGCVLVELFTDTPPFTLSTLLAYRAGEHSVDKLLEKIEDENIRVILKPLRNS